MITDPCQINNYRWAQPSHNSDVKSCFEKILQRRPRAKITTTTLNIVNNDNDLSGNPKNESESIMSLIDELWR